MDNFQLVVGSKDCPINTVGLIIRSSTLISNEWSTLARGLNIESEQIKRLRDDRLLNKLTYPDVICEVLELWVGKDGSRATLGKLLNVVEGPCRANDVGESLRLGFGLPCQEADGNPSIDWNDISPAFQNRIIETFQKFFPTLKFLEILPNLKGHVLIKLMIGKKPPLFVHPFPDTLCYYINRTLITRNIISKKVFQLKSQDIFLFTGMDPPELSALAGSTLTGTSSAHLRDSSTVKFMTLDRSHHFEMICEKTHHPVHLLRREDDGRLRWTSSNGGMDNLRKYVDQLQDDFDEEAFCRHVTSSTTTSVLICDSPGMGKSVLLAQIGATLSQIYPDQIVLFIVLTEFIKLIKSIDMEDEIKMIEIALQKLTGEPIRHSNMNLEETTVRFELLLDGFDELDSADYKLAHSTLRNISISFKSTRLWVTSRPHLMEELETSLNLLGFNIRPFNEQDQVKFLSSFWSRNEQLHEERSELFAIKCLKSLKSKMGSPSHDIAGIPLQCLLIGEVYEKDALEFAQLNNGNGTPIGIEIQIGTITNLYRRLIRKKIDKYESLNNKFSEADLMAVHAQLGLKLLFPGKLEALKLEPVLDESDFSEFLKVGIIVKSLGNESSYAFLHRTFAEYLVAWFVVDKLRRELLEREWTVEINDFFFNCILECQNIKYYKYIEGDYIQTFEFAEPVICYFLNSFIADLRVRNDSSHICSQVDGKSPELMNIIVRACANHDFVHIFKLFHERYKFDEYYKTTIFTIDLLLHSIRHSSLELVKSIINQLEEDDKFSMEGQAKALCRAVRLGKFSIMEILIKEKQLCNIVKDLSYGTGRLVLDCIQSSKYCSDDDIENKVQVLRMLIRINGSLLNNEVNERAPLLFDNVHVKLLIELVKLGADVLAEQGNYTVLHLLDTYHHHRLLSSSDYHLLLMSIPEGNLLKLVHIREGLEGHTPLISALKWIDPAPETLEIFHRVGADFNYITPTGCSMLQFAIINGRSAVTIRSIIQYGNIKVLEHKRVNFFSIMQFSRPIHRTNILHIAAKWGNVEAVGVLVDEYGMDVNSEDEHGLTPLDLVIKSNNDLDRFNTGLALKARGGRFKNDNSLIVAVTEANIQSVRLLISFGVDVYRRHKQGNTALNTCVKPKDEDEYFKHQFTLDEEKFISILNNFCKLHQVNVSLIENVGNFAAHVATAKGHLKGLQLLVEKGADINLQNSLGETPLHLAASKGYIDLLRLLVEKGCDLNVQNKLGETPLHIATSERYISLHQVLVDNGADLNVKNILGETPLHVAASKGYIDLLKLLVKKGADLNVKNNLGETPIYVAVSKGYLGLSQFFVEKGADLNVKNNLGETPLHVAVSKGYLGLPDLLVENGADLNVKNNMGETPIHVVVSKGYLKWVQLLVEEGADLNVKSNVGETPLHVAVSKGYLGLADLLVEKGADLNVKNNLGVTPLHVVVSKGYLKRLQRFVEKGADLNVKNNSGDTPLHIAVTQRYFEFVQFLLEKGADLNVKNNLGETPLHLAVNQEYLEFMQLLVEKGANLNIKNNLEETPLHLAVTQEYLEFIQHLVEKGADLNVKNNLGDTPLHVAVTQKYLEFTQYLVRKGADLNMKNNLGETPLHVAANEGCIKCLQLLVQQGADLNVQNNLGETPLHVVVSKRYIDLLQLLVKKGAYLNVKNNLNETPLHVAVSKGYLEIPQLLVKKRSFTNEKNT